MVDADRKRRLVTARWVTVLFCGVGLWRLALAAGHGWNMLSIEHDPSVKEFYQLSLFVETAYALAAFAHAGLARIYARHAAPISLLAIGNTAVLTGAASFLWLRLSLRTVPLRPGVPYGPAVLALIGAILSFLVRKNLVANYVGAWIGALVALVAAYKPLGVLSVWPVAGLSVLYFLTGVGVAGAIRFGAGCLTSRSS